MRIELGVAAAALTLASVAPGRTTLEAQSAADPSPTFEVASVKRNVSGQPFVRIGGGAIGRF